MKINFWYNEGCRMWRWTVSSEDNVTHSFSHSDKEVAIFRLMNTISDLAKED